uniref:Uncharacterized protein n=1 Tax=Clytia hemisphaerica TaxID=252671 RepID=A0A7M5V370_9CNID
LYTCFKDLALDIRSIHAKEDRINSFEKRAESFFEKLIAHTGSQKLDGLPYLHVLRNHLSKTMKVLYDLFGWGYGMFSTHAGEHLNKTIKQWEASSSNFDKRGFMILFAIFDRNNFSSMIIYTRRIEK